jgi:hypothetical protein
MNDEQYTHFLETGVMYGNFLTAVYPLVQGDIVHGTIPVHILRHIEAAIDQIDYDEGVGMYQWTGTIDPSAGDDSLHQEITNTLRLLNSLLFELKRLHKNEKDKQVMKKRSKLELSKLLSTKLIDDNKDLRDLPLDSGILSMISDALDKHPVHATTLSRFNKGKIRKHKTKAKGKSSGKSSKSSGKSSKSSGKSSKSSGKSSKRTRRVGPTPSTEQPDILQDIIDAGTSSKRTHRRPSKRTKRDQGKQSPEYKTFYVGPDRPSTCKTTTENL